MHAVTTTAGKAVWVFLSGSFKPGLENPFKQSEVNQSCGNIFIIIKASTQQGCNWLTDWAFV